MTQIVKPARPSPPIEFGKISRFPVRDVMPSPQTLSRIAGVIHAIEDFHVPADGDADWQKAVARAQVQFPHGAALYFRNRVYTCSDSIVLITCMRLIGDGGGTTNGATVLAFPNGTGILAEFPASNVGETGPGDASFSVIEHITLWGAGPSGPVGHGVDMKARLTLREVGVASFNGNGINIVADATMRPASNANGWILDHCRIQNCTGHGLYLQGGDTNAGFASALDVDTVAGWGINDESFLGNTYLACQVANCGAGAYQNSGLNAASVFVSCYQEDGQKSSITAPAMVLGGGLAQSFGGTGAGLSMGGIGKRANFVNGISSNSGSVTGRIGGEDPATALQFYDNEHYFWPFDLRYGKWGKGWWSMVWANLDQPGPFGFCVGNEQATEMGIDPNDACMFWLPYGAFLGWGDSRIKMTVGSAPLGQHPQGTVMYNSRPIPGGFVGWVSVGDGTWRGFGAIEKLAGDP